MPQVKYQLLDNSNCNCAQVLVPVEPELFPNKVGLFCQVCLGPFEQLEVGLCAIEPRPAKFHIEIVDGPFDDICLDGVTEFDLLPGGSLSLDISPCWNYSCPDAGGGGSTGIWLCCNRFPSTWLIQISRLWSPPANTCLWRSNTCLGPFESVPLINGNSYEVCQYLTNFNCDNPPFTVRITWDTP